MDQDGFQHTDSENESRESAKFGEKKDKRRISRSSTGDGEEWILVNSLGSEVENSSCQVETNANFEAPVANEDTTLAVHELSTAVVELLAITKSNIVDNVAITELSTDFEPKNVPVAEEITSAANLSTPEASLEGEIKDVISQKQEKTDDENESNIGLSYNNDFEVDELSVSTTSSTVAGLESNGYEIVNTTRSTAEQTEEEQNENEVETEQLNDDPSFRSETTNVDNHPVRSLDTSLSLKMTIVFVLIPTILVAVGIGKCLYLAQDMSRLHASHDDNIRRVQENQLKLLRDQLSDCTYRVSQAQVPSSVVYFKAQFEDGKTVSRGCQDDFCTVEQKSVCGDGMSDLGSQIADCTDKLALCQRRLSQTEEENKKRTNDLAKAFHDMRLLRHNVMQIHATYERLVKLLIDEKRRSGKRQRRQPFDTLENDQEAEELVKKLHEAEFRENKLMKQEVELRQMLSKLEATVAALNLELAKVKSQKVGSTEHLGMGYNEQTNMDEDEDPEEEDDEETNNSDFNWTHFTDLLQQLKDTANFNQVAENYLDVFKRFQLPDIEKLWPKELPSKIEEMAASLKNKLDEKVHELEDTIYSTDWDGYVQQAKVVTARVGDTVGTLWQKAKDLSDRVKERHGEQGEKLLDKIKTTVEKATEVFDQRWEQATRFWRDVIGSNADLDQDQEDAGAMYDDENSEAPTSDEVGSQEMEADATNDHYTAEVNRDNWNDQTIDSAMNQHDGDQILSSATKINRIDEANEIRQFREILKTSPVFSRYITDEFADHYFRRLKQAARLLSSQASNDQSIWWTCQKLWWARHTFAYSRQCSDKLMTWQRHVRLDADVRPRLVDQSPELRNLLKKFALDESSDRGLHDDGNWLFEWAKNRQEMRKDDDIRKKNEEKHSWLYDRWRNRDEMRNQQADLPPASKWLFRRGKEREKKREEAPSMESFSRRRRTSSESKDPAGKPLYFQKNRR